MANKKKLSKKQIDLIAKLWVGNIVKHFGIDSFEPDFTQAGSVTKAAYRIGADLTKGHPELYKLENIIRYVKMLDL